MATVVDLFCGAGGLTAGLEAVGWRTVAAVDRDCDCTATLALTSAAGLRVPDGSGRTFLQGTRLVHGDVTELSAVDLRPPGANSRWRPDLLAGGPPCQPFSSAGRQLGVADPRGQLFLEFVRLADELKPRFILFENVRGLVTAKTPDGRPGGVLRRIQEEFEGIGYACRFQLLNSADYGAPQRRVRLFMLASSDRPLPRLPPPSHSASPQPQLVDGRKPWVTLGEFLAAQPEPDPADVVRPPASRLAALSALPPGTGLRSQGIVEANRPGGHWGYRQDCFVADLALPARTIRAASTPDWTRQPDGGLRRLTWRECAGLQGFPTGWCFTGTVASRFRQIGNAVQGDVAAAIGAVLLSALSQDRSARPRSAQWPAEFHRRVRYTAMEHRVNGAHRAAARQA
ncbi:MAG: DNA cytosine methyltransferase [Egibacteraceae bacterium]